MRLQPPCPRSPRLAVLLIAGILALWGFEQPTPFSEGTYHRLDRCLGSHSVRIRRHDAHTHRLANWRRRSFGLSVQFFTALSLLSLHGHAAPIVVTGLAADIHSLTAKATIGSTAQGELPRGNANSRPPQPGVRQAESSASARVVTTSASRIAPPVAGVHIQTRRVGTS